MQERGAQEEQTTDKGAGGQEVAVISMACRLPDGVCSPEQFWQQLSEGRESITEVPTSRWSNEYWYGPDRPGKINSRHGGFLHNIEEFDPTFFDISEDEAGLYRPGAKIAAGSWLGVFDRTRSPQVNRQKHD